MLRIKPTAIRFAFVAPSEHVSPLLLRSAWLPFEAACVLEGAIDVVGVQHARQVVVFLPDELADDDYRVIGGEGAAKERILRLKDVIAKNHPDEKRVDAGRLVQWALGLGILSPAADVARLVLGAAKAHKLHRPMDGREITALDAEGSAALPKRKHQGKGSAASKKREHILRAFVHELAKRWGSFDECVSNGGPTALIAAPKLAETINDYRFSYPTPLGHRVERDDGIVREDTYSYGHSSILQIIRWVIHDTEIPKATPTERELALKAVLLHLLAHWGRESISIRSVRRSHGKGSITEIDPVALAETARATATGASPRLPDGLDASVFVAVLNDLNQE